MTVLFKFKYYLKLLKTTERERLFLFFLAIILFPLIALNPLQNQNFFSKSNTNNFPTFNYKNIIIKLSGFSFIKLNNKKEIPLSELVKVTVFNPFILAEKKYGVNSQILIAQYKLESEGGTNVGSYSPYKTLNSYQIKAYEDICLELNIDPKSKTVSKSGDMGPMQFQPATWQSFKIDANGDGIANPWDLEDAVFSSANYLKSIGYDISPRLALSRYNGGYNYSSRAKFYAAKIIRDAKKIDSKINF